MRAIASISAIGFFQISAAFAQPPCDKICVPPERCVHSNNPDIDVRPYCGDTTNLNVPMTLEKLGGSFSFSDENGREVTVTTEKPKAE